jgi:hypothetical protein
MARGTPDTWWEMEPQHFERVKYSLKHAISDGDIMISTDRVEESQL